MAAQEEPAAVGISIGLCNSSVAVFRNQTLEVCRNDLGCKLTPSMVSFQGLDYVSGQEAVDQQYNLPETTLYDFIRLNGIKAPDNDMEPLLRYWPFNVITEGDRYQLLIARNGEQVRVHPEELMAILIAKMKSVAEATLGRQVTCAVLTVPTSYTIPQRIALCQAATIAGLERVKLINQTTAVALTYMYRRSLDEPFETYSQRVMVCNMGAGTTDAAVFNIDRNRLEVKSACGCAKLGGDDFTNDILETMGDDIQFRHRKNLFKDYVAVMRLRLECERMKRELSTRNQSNVSIDQLLMLVNFKASMNRHRFENLLNLRHPIRNLIRTAMRDCHEDIDEVLLTGGSSRIPYFRNLVREITGVHPDFSLLAEESPAMGAAVLALKRFSDQLNPVGPLSYKDVAYSSIRLTTAWGVDQFVIRRNEQIPTSVLLIVNIPEEIEDEPLHIQVYEGDQMVATSNTKVGHIEVEMDGVQHVPIDKLKIVIRVSSDGIPEINSIKLTHSETELNCTFVHHVALTGAQVDRLRDRFPRVGLDLP